VPWFWCTSRNPAKLICRLIRLVVCRNTECYYLSNLTKSQLTFNLSYKEQQTCREEWGNKRIFLYNTCCLIILEASSVKTCAEYFPVLLKSGVVLLCRSRPQPTEPLSDPQTEIIGYIVYCKVFWIVWQQIHLLVTLYLTFIIFKRMTNV